MILTDADELREALRVALAERDDLRSRLEALQETNAATMRVIAEAQREACAAALEGHDGHYGLHGSVARKMVRGTPLVTEVEP